MGGDRWQSALAQGLRNHATQSLETTRGLGHPLHLAGYGGRKGRVLTAQGPASRVPKKGIPGCWPWWGRRIDLVGEPATEEEVISKQDPLPLQMLARTDVNLK